MSRPGTSMQRVWADQDHRRLQEPVRRIRFAEPDRRDRLAEPDRRDRLAEPLRNAGSDPQYAVLLLNEQQMAQLLNRPALTPITPQFVRATDAFASYTRLMRHARIVMVVLAVLIAGASAWAWAPLPSLSDLPWTREKLPPTVATGASFSLTLPASGADQSQVARRLVASGTPAFARPIGSTSSRQVMVGPFVTLDEAEQEQGRLARSGFTGTRVFVDDSLRRAPRNGVVADAATHPALVLVGVGDRMSLAIELKNEVRQVNTNRAADGTMMVEIGPLQSDLDAQEWSAPAGVDLVRRMKVEEIAVTPEASYLRATLTMPATTVATARVEGRRVYIDMSRPARGSRPRTRDSGASGKGAAQRAGSVRAAEPGPSGTIETSSAAAGAIAKPLSPAPAAEAARSAGGEALKPLVGRFDRLVPFLQSAAATASPDVLRALGSSIDELEAALRQFVPSPESADAHDALVSAVAPARRSVDAGFTGDRVAQARQAGMLVEAAKTVMPE